MTELRSLTGVRGIAAWFVVLYHIRGSIAGLPGWVERVFAKGYLAVDFFFLLSGFVIWLAWNERLREGGVAGVARFLHRRVARIWPLHLAMLAFALALAGLLAATGRAVPATFDLRELPLHLLLVQNWGFTDALAWNDPAWSISCEWAAYLLVPALAIAVDWRRVATPVLLAVLAALFVALHLAMRGAPTLGYEIARFGLVRCLFEFCAGTVVCALWQRIGHPHPHPHSSPPSASFPSSGGRGREARSAGRVRVILGAAVVLFAACVVGLLPETLAIPPAFAAILLTLALTDGGSPFGRRAIHYLGEISYATYLSHFLLFFAFKLGLPSPMLSPAQVAAYLAIVLGASVGLYHGIERPAQRRVNALRFGRRQPASA